MTCDFTGGRHQSCGPVDDGWVLIVAGPCGTGAGRKAGASSGNCWPTVPLLSSSGRRSQWRHGRGEPGPGQGRPWRRRVAYAWRSRWGRSPGIPASSPTARTTWVIPEMVSRPRCPVHSGPSWVPRSSSQAARCSRPVGGSGTVRTSSPLPCRRMWPVRAVRVTSPASRRPHSSTRAPAYSSVATIARSRTPRRAAALLEGQQARTPRRMLRSSEFSHHWCSSQLPWADAVRVLEGE